MAGSKGGIGKERQSLRLRQPVDPVLRDLGTQDHQKRAVFADSRLQRIEHSVGPAVQAANGTQRHVNHERIAAPNAEVAEVISERRGSS